MPDSADQTASAVASDEQEYRFNKFGSVGKAAGFLLASTGYMIRSAMRGLEGERTVSAAIADLSAPARVIYSIIFLTLLTVLIKAILKPAAALRVTASQAAYTVGSTTQTIDISAIKAVAPFETKGRGLFGRRNPQRSLAILAVGGSNLSAVPKGVRWKSINPVNPHYEDEMIDRDLVDQILSDTVETELPDDDFGNRMRRGVPATVTRQVAELKKANPDLKAIVIPLKGMPTNTEDELRETLPNWR